MSHDYNTRTKKESVVSSECLQTLEANIINNINSLNDEIISLKDTAIKRLQEENERLHIKCQQLENRVAFIESSHDALEQHGMRNNLVISGIPDSVQDSELESTITSILSDIDVNLESREVEECHRIGKSNNGSEKTIIRFVNRKYCKKALLNRKQLERIDLKKPHLVSGTRIFKKKELYIWHIYEEWHSYVKQNENSRSVVILDMNVLHDMFPNF